MQKISSATASLLRQISELTEQDLFTDAEEYADRVTVLQQLGEVAGEAAKSGVVNIEKLGAASFPPGYWMDYFVTLRFLRANKIMHTTKYSEESSDIVVLLPDGGGEGYTLPIYRRSEEDGGDVYDLQIVMERIEEDEPFADIVGDVEDLLS